MRSGRLDKRKEMSLDWKSFATARSTKALEWNFRDQRRRG